MGGGTGSGLGTYTLELLADEYPRAARIATAVFPSESDDVITSPYNTVRHPTPTRDARRQ